MAVSTEFPQQGFNGALVTREYKSPYSSLKHTEANTVAQWFGGDPGKIFLGILKPWNMTQYVSTPLINMTELAGNTIEVNGYNAELEMMVPYKYAPARLRAVYGETGDKLGINGSIFFWELDKNHYGPNDILTTKLRDGVQVRVVEEREFYGQPVVEPVASDTWKYAVQLVSIDPDAYVTPDMFPVGIPIQSIANYSGEFDTVRETVKDVNPVGLYALRTNIEIPEMGVTHSVTSWGDGYHVESADSKGQYGMGGSYNISQQDMVSEYLQGSFTNNGKTGAKEFNVKKRAWVPTIIKMMVEQLAYSKEKALMWQKPFIRNGAGGKKQRIPAGYYYYIKEFGNYDTYSDFTELPNIVRYLASKVFSNARMLQPIDRKLRIKTGTGGAIELYKWLTDAGQSQLTKVLLVNDGRNPLLNGLISGKDAQNLSFNPIRFVSGHFPELGMVEVIVDPVLDFIDEDHEFQGREGLYNNSSYMIFIEDITDEKYSNRASGMPSDPGILKDTYHNSSNVVMLKNKGYEEATTVEVGTGSNPTLSSYFGIPANGRVVSTQRKGFTITMDTHGALFVKDPTKIVLIEYVPKRFTPTAF